MGGNGRWGAAFSARSLSETGETAMSRTLAAAALPMFALLAACGGQEITTTNDSNVVSNDVYANAAFRNDGELGNEMIRVNPVDTGENTPAGNAMMGDTPDGRAAAAGNTNG
jgi:hypothetical protein